MKVVKIKLGESLRKAVEDYMAGLPLDYPESKSHDIMDLVARHEVKEGKWIYQYLRADGEEIDMGPFDTIGEAESDMRRQMKLGTFCTDLKYVDKDYPLYKGELV